MNHNNNEKKSQSSGDGFAGPPEGDFGKMKDQDFPAMPGAPDGMGDFAGFEGVPDEMPDFAAMGYFPDFSGDPEYAAQGEESKAGARDFSKKGFGGMGSMGGGNLNYTDDQLDSYSTIWEGAVNDSNQKDHRRVITALRNIQSGKDIEKYIDVDQVLKYMAVHNFSVNEDSLSGNMAHNYYLYESGGQISIVPWDYNLSFGGMGRGTGTSVVNAAIDDTWDATELFNFVLENEEYKARYHAYYNQLMEEYMDSGRFEETYQRIRSQIDTLVKEDPNAMYDYDAYTKAADILHETILLRAQSVKGQLAGTIPATSEEQEKDDSALIDASHIQLSDMGQFMMGGFQDLFEEAESAEEDIEEKSG